MYIFFSFGYLRTYHKPYIYTALPKKQAKTKQGAHRAVSTSKLVISIRLPTLTQLCFSCTGNSLKCGSLILLRFISLGHKSYFDKKDQGGFKVHHRSYSPVGREESIAQEQPHSAVGDRSQTCDATPGTPTLWLLMLSGKSSPRYARALPSSKRVQHPRRNPN